MVRALDAGAGAIKFGHAHDIEQLHPAEKFRNLAPHGHRGALRAVDHLLQIDLVGDPPLVHLFGHQQAHGGGAAQHRALQVHQEFAVHVDVARPHRDGQGAQPLAAQLEAHPRGPDAVAHGDLHPVQGGDPGHLVAAGEEIPPVVDVLLGVADDLAFAGGAAGGVDAHDLLIGHRPEREGVAVPQVFPRGQGEFLQVVQGSGWRRGRPRPHPAGPGKSWSPHRRGAPSTASPLAGGP